ncbi:MAG: DegT/DnrJ/EryC1/StrS family aminotransferase [Deltaproteobacteria bacterium]|jgi:dTDP-4-amino-4,6-dideoxygalactose transaminase|nr:DegT/DnrJ/EryC1/StrS family aminotransferase [Deltaproteobacteria bacterium]
MGLQFIDLKKQFEVLEERLRPDILSAAGAAQYINGPQTRKLEEALAGYVGVKHCLGCANGTDALTLALLAWGVGPGEAVFCPTFTFIATAEVVSLRGAEPVFVDIDPKTYNIDPESLEREIIRVKKEGRLKPKGVIPVDLFGLPYDSPKISQIAARYDLFVLEDAAQGFGGAINGQKAGSFSQVGTTSFFPAKPLGCYGDGGAVFTNDDDLAEIFRSLKIHGAGSHRYEHVRIGLNSRLDTIQAAILLVKLSAFPGELEKRLEVARRYDSLLKGEVETPFIPDNYLSSYAQYTIRVPEVKREGLIEALKEKGIPLMVYYPKCLHLQPVFLPLGGREGQLPHAEKASKEVLSLPMHPYLSLSDQQFITQSFIEAISRL